MKTTTTLAASEPALGTTLPINMTTQDTAPPKHQLEQCPKCRCKITLGAKLCPYCGSNFGLEIKKPILQPKTDGFIQPSVVINFVMAKFGLLMLLIGMAVALDPHDNADAKAWAYGCIFGMLIVIFSAFTLRPHWMLLITLGAVALGFSSCTTNFHWHGG